MYILDICMHCRFGEPMVDLRFFHGDFNPIHTFVGVAEIVLDHPRDRYLMLVLVLMLLSLLLRWINITVLSHLRV